MLAVALAWVGNADASHQYDDAVRCNGQTVRQAQLVTRSRDGAIFFKRRAGPGGSRVSVAYACMLRSGSIERLDFANRVSRAQLAGRYAAYAHTLYVSEFGSASGITVVDLKTGQTKVDEPGVPGATGDSHLMSFVAKLNGSVAWIGIGERGDDVSVWKVDATGGGAQQLDSGASIEWETLRISPDRRSISWVNGAERKTAPLS